MLFLYNSFVLYLLVDGTLVP